MHRGSAGDQREVQSARVNFSLRRPFYVATWFPFFHSLFAAQSCTPSACLAMVVWFVSVLFLVEVFVCCRRREKHVVSLSVCVLVVSFVKNPKIDGVVFNSVVYGKRIFSNTRSLRCYKRSMQADKSGKKTKTKTSCLVGDSRFPKIQAFPLLFAGGSYNVRSWSLLLHAMYFLIDVGLRLLCASFPLLLITTVFAILFNERRYLLFLFIWRC